MPLKRLFKSARKRVKKLIPKEIRPFVPYLAAMIPGANLGLGALSPALQKAIIAGGTRFATDDEADIKDIGITAALASAPDALGQFSKSGEAAKLSMGDPGFFKQQAQLGASKLAGLAKDKPLTTLGVQAGTDAAIKQIELDQEALEKYEADLLSRGIKNKAARRNAIFNIFVNAGYTDDEVNSMLDSYGYAEGGPVNLGMELYLISKKAFEKDGYSPGEAHEKALDASGMREYFDDLPKDDYRVGGKVKKKETPSAGIMTTIEADAKVNDDDDEISIEEFIDMMKGGDDDEVSIDDSLSYAQQGLGMLQGDVKPMPMMRFADGGFGGITEAVESIEEKPKEFLVDKLKVTQKPGQSEMRAIIEAMYNDIDGVMPEDRKREFYELYAPQMYGSGEMEKPEFEFIQTEILGKEMKAAGGRIGFRDGSSTGNFGADRYASELVEAYKGILDKGDMFYTDVEKELIEKGEYPSQDQMKEFQDRYENLEKEYEKEEDKFGNVDLQDSLLDKDAIKYYNKKVKDLEDREEKLIDKEEKLNEVMYTDLDVSGILKTPEFQEWYRLWKVNDPKADNLPGAEYFEDMMFNTKRLRPDMMKTKYNVEMKDGGIMNLGGKEMDLRGGGFVPIGKKERADDVPARLSKNEFVMTADAVRAAGGGSVNKGAKRMYNLMNSLEARV